MTLRLLEKLTSRIAADSFFEVNKILYGNSINDDSKREECLQMSSQVLNLAYYLLDISRNYQDFRTDFKLDYLLTSILYDISKGIENDLYEFGCKDIAVNNGVRRFFEYYERIMND